MGPLRGPLRRNAASWIDWGGGAHEILKGVRISHNISPSLSLKLLTHPLRYTGPPTKVSWVQLHTILSTALLPLSPSSSPSLSLPSSVSSYPLPSFNGDLTPALSYMEPSGLLHVLIGYNVWSLALAFFSTAILLLQHLYQKVYLYWWISRFTCSVFNSHTKKHYELIMSVYQEGSKRLLSVSTPVFSERLRSGWGWGPWSLWPDFFTSLYMPLWTSHLYRVN